MRAPILSIVMPVFNSEKYVGTAIESILKQTYNDFELIIIDDGSTDGSLKIIKSFKDKRIRIIINDSNRGIVYSRNRGLQEAKGKYIGMFDSDDVAHSSKFEEQIEFLEKNKDFGMVGSWVRIIDEMGNLTGKNWKLTASSEMIPAIMLFKNYFLQSAVLYRSECISKYRFQEDFEIGEDYKIWLEIIADYRVWNIQKYLVQYRVHPQSSTSNHALLRQYDEVIFTGLLKRLNIASENLEIKLHLMLRYDDKISDIKTLILIEEWLDKIILQNEIVKVYDRIILTKVVFNRWLKACYMARSLHLGMILTFISSRILRLYVFAFIKLALKDKKR